MTSQPVTESDLSFFRKESLRRRQVYEARKACSGKRSKWAPGPEMQMKIINGVKLSVWMIIAIVILSYLILKHTESKLEKPGNSFQDHTRQIIFHSTKQVEEVGKNVPENRSLEVIAPTRSFFKWF